MKIGSWNISSGINVNNYKDELFDITPRVNVNDECLIQISQLIKQNNLDIIALQEVITTPSFHFLENLSKLTGLKYFCEFEISPGFLIENTRFGVAILSKYPIKNIQNKLFKNPNLNKVTEKGTYSSHDKGYISATINGITFISTQFLPFHRFNEKIVNFKYYFNEFQSDVIKNNAIVCGDFNAVSGASELGKVLDKLQTTHTFCFNDVTTTDGKLTDNILLPKGTKIKNKYIETKITPSDHFLCVIEI